MDTNVIALATCQRVFSWVSVYPPTLNTPLWKRILFKIFPIMLITTDLTGFMCSAVYFWESMTTSLENSLYTLFQISGLIVMTNAVIVTFFLRHKWPNIFNSLMVIYEASTIQFKINILNVFSTLAGFELFSYIDLSSNLDAERELFQFLIKANDRSEWIWRIYLKMTCVALTIVLIIMPGASVVFQLVVCEHFNGNLAFHPFLIRLPWNQKSLLGYFAELCYGAIAGVCSMFLSGVQLIVFISICLHHRAFYKIFRQIVRKLNSKRNRTDKHLSLCELIRFHISVKKWFAATADVYSPYILVHLICITIYLASNIFSLDLQLRHPGYSLTMILVLTVISISNLLFYCLFGKIASDSFMKMVDCLFESNWQELSMDLQKYLILMIANAQTPLHYHGFGMAVLNLESFTKMLKIAISYYMLFKTLTNK